MKAFTYEEKDFEPGICTNSSVPCVAHLYSKIHVSKVLKTGSPKDYSITDVIFRFLPTSGPNVQECDETGDATCIVARNIKNLIRHIAVLLCRIHLRAPKFYSFCLCLFSCADIEQLHCKRKRHGNIDITLIDMTVMKWLKAFEE